MNEYPYAPRELGWDDEISRDSGFVLLEEGDYSFTVTAFERGRFPGSPKIPPCNKAILTLTVDAPGGAVDVKYDLILYSTLEWKLSEFFRAIGQKKHGEPLRPRWNEVVGARGRARFKPRTYVKKDSSPGQANDVDRFYDCGPAPLQAPPAAEASPQQTWVELPASTPTPWDSGTF